MYETMTSQFFLSAFIIFFFYSFNKNIKIQLFSVYEKRKSLFTFPPQRQQEWWWDESDAELGDCGFRESYYHL